MAARADLIVEGAVDFVLLGAEDGGEVVRHGDVGAEGGFVRAAIENRRQVGSSSFPRYGWAKDETLR